MTIRCLLFDLDNTLTDRRASITLFTHRFMAQFGHQLADIEFDILEQAIQTGDNLGYKPKTQMFEELATNLPWKTPQSIEMIRDFWYSESPTCMQPRVGMITTLDALQTRDYRLGMITNGQTRVQNATIDALGIRNMLETIVISEAAGVRKPDAAIFKLALANMSMPTQESIYVGDHPHSDMQGAKNANITGIWLRSGGHPWPEGQSPPDTTIDNLVELIDLLAD